MNDSTPALWRDAKQQAQKPMIGPLMKPIWTSAVAYEQQSEIMIDVVYGSQNESVLLNVAVCVASPALPPCTSHAPERMPFASPMASISASRACCLAAKFVSVQSHSP